MGPGRPARGTLVSTVPTVAPGPTMGMQESATEAKRRGPKRCLPGPRHVERSGSARGHDLHDLLDSNGRTGGARHDRAPGNKA